MTDLESLTETQKAALRGELPVEQFNDVGMSLFSLGLLAIDPLALDEGAPTCFVITDEGRAAALQLRKRK